MKCSKGPDEECIERGAKYSCLIDHGDRNRTGKIYDEHGALRWQYGVRSNLPRRGRGNPFNKPDFYVADPVENSELLIRRISFVPSHFHMLDRDRLVGRISM